MLHFKLPLAVLTILSLCFAFTVGDSVSCLNEKGTAVDWWVVLKLPINSSSSNVHEAAGFAYSYLDSTGSSFKISSIGLENSNQGAIGLTVGQFYSNSSTITHVFYNDESPDDNNHQSYGHTKGILGIDSDSGIWLVHSVPRWPPYVSSGYSFPSYAATYGQSFLCMNYNISEMTAIVETIKYNHPFIFDSKVTASTAKSIPGLVDLVNGVYYKTNSTDVTNLATLGGKKFTAFAKTTAWNSDLYMDLVQSYYKIGMNIETWTNGVNPLPSQCPPSFPYDSINIALLVYPEGYSYTRTKDHSKWAISEKSTNAIVCIGDINRQASMVRRAGGTVCVTDSKVWTAFNQLIAQVNAC